MGDIPDDIMSAAYKIIDESDGSISKNDWIANRIAAAILAERQRCADVCEGRAKEYDKITSRNAAAGDPHEPEGKLSYEARRCARDIIKI